MKQKYNITVADTQMNIISDATPEQVENLVGILDRRIRELQLKSPHCTKVELAILCALACCSERIAAQDSCKRLEKDSFRYAAEVEKQKKQLEQMEVEMEALRRDAEVMRTILAHTAPAEATPVTGSYAPKPFRRQEEAEPSYESIPASAPAPEVPAAPSAPVGQAPAAPAVPEGEVRDKKPVKPVPKNHAGGMFDTLSFVDI